jgi:hypothetical protein
MRAGVPAGVRLTGGGTEAAPDPVVVTPAEPTPVAEALALLVSYLLVPTGDPPAAPPEAPVGPATVHDPGPTPPPVVVPAVVGDGALPTGFRSTALLDVLFALNPLPTQSAVPPGVAHLPATGLAAAPAFLVPGQERREGPGGLGLNLLAAASAFAALGLTGWCVVRTRRPLRPQGALTPPPGWAGEDSTSLVEG